MPSVFPSSNHPGNWMEDSRDNVGSGLYMNNCVDCNTHFLGHKYRHVCKVCDDKRVKRESEYIVKLSEPQPKGSALMGGPISKIALIESVGAHIAASLGINPNDAIEMEGAVKIAEAALDYFSSSSRGAPVSSGQTLQWAIFSALWDGRVDQEEINAFFTKVNNDPGRVIQMWRTLTPEQRQGDYSVVLVPGKLSDADIADVTAALFHSRAQP